MNNCESDNLNYGKEYRNRNSVAEFLIFMPEVRFIGQQPYPDSFKCSRKN